MATGRPSHLAREAQRTVSAHGSIGGDSRLTMDSKNGDTRAMAVAFPVHAGRGLLAGEGELLMNPKGASPQLDFTWAPTKAASNLAKHGVAFAQAATVLLDALALTVFDAEHSEFEERFFTLGLSSEGRLLAVSHTYTITGPHRAQVRIISARAATRNERRQYENEA